MQIKNKILEVKNLSCGYKRKQRILKNLNFSLYDDEFLGIVGPNASGKTTLLKTILGIIKPLEGKIVKNKDIKFGYVPQIFTVDETFPFSVYDILSFAFLKNFKFKLTKQEKQKIDEILEKFNIKEIKFKLYKDLSGGLKQKILILRSLLREPDVLVLDEPTNDLDIFNTKISLEFIKNLKKEQKFTVIVVSHSLEIILNYVERLFVVNNNTIEIINKLEDIDLLQNRIKDVFKTNTKIFEVDNWRFIKV